MTDRQKQSMQALSQDLYRVALGRYRGQLAMASRFKEEALKRTSEVEKSNLINKVIDSLKSTEERSAEDLLMYSFLLRNRSV